MKVGKWALSYENAFVLLYQIIDFVYLCFQVLNNFLSQEIEKASGLRRIINGVYSLPEGRLKLSCAYKPVECTGFYCIR